MYVLSFFLSFFVFPTDPFTIFEPQHQDIGKIYVVRERYTTEFAAPKLEKGRSGFPLFLSSASSGRLINHALNQS